MTRTKRIVVWAALASVPLALLLGMCVFYRGDGATTLRGQVVDPDGTPIAGASVRLYEVGQEHRIAKSVSDPAGRFSVNLLHAPYDVPLVVTVSKHGYRPYRMEFRASQRGDVPEKVVLEPEPATPGNER